MRLRSRCGVFGLDQRAGKSVARERIRSFSSSVRAAGRRRWRGRGPRARLCRARSASFQSASRLSAMSRLSGRRPGSGGGPARRGGGRVRRARAQRSASATRVSSPACTVSATSSACGVRASRNRLPTAASTTPPGTFWQRCRRLGCSDSCIGSRGPDTAAGVVAQSFGVRSARRWPGPAAARCLPGRDRRRNRRRGRWRWPAAVFGWSRTCPG